MNQISSFLSKAEVVGQFPRHNLDLLVIVLSFNQADYIREAVDSVLKQEGLENLKVIIHDDASHDNSQNIIRDIVDSYPDKVFGILQRENVFTKRVNILGEIQNLYPSEFVARLDADDFWLSRNKLSVQLSFLKSHSRVAVIAHSCLIYDEGRQVYEQDMMKRVGLIDSKLLALCNFISTASVMYRTENFLPLPDAFTNYYIQDWSLWATMASRGELYFLDNLFSVYRIHAANGYAGRRNIDFLQDTLGVNRMLVDFLPKEFALSWRSMLVIRFLMGNLDRITFGKASSILNRTCNYIVGIKREVISVEKIIANC